MNHTSTPWKVIEPDKKWGDLLIIRDCSDREGVSTIIARVKRGWETRSQRIHPFEQLCNAEHIVKCVNAWDDVRVLKARIAELKGE